MISIEDLVRHRRRHEVRGRGGAETRLLGEYGEFTAYGYRITIDDSEHAGAGSTSSSVQAIDCATRVSTGASPDTSP